MFDKESCRLVQGAIDSPLSMLLLTVLLTSQTWGMSSRSPRRNSSQYKGESRQSSYTKTKSKSSSSSSSGSSYSSSKAKLRIGDVFQYQLDGSIRNHNVDVVFVDVFDTSSSTISSLKKQGKVVVCYFSAGTAENWRSDYGRIPASAKGRSVDGWSGEKWMDIRRSDVVSLSRSRIDKARSKGCDGVDPDNVDVYDNSSGFSISSTDVKNYLRNLAAYSHSRGLLMGLKNSAEIASYMSAYTDFAVVEECFQWNECGSYSSFISRKKPVFIVEYRSYSSSLCSNAKSRKMSLIFADEDLDGSISYCR